MQQSHPQPIFELVTEMDPDEDLISSQELTEAQMATALQIVDFVQRGNPPPPLPQELKHLQPMDWEMLSSLWVSIKQEMVYSRLH